MKNPIVITLIVLVVFVGGILFYRLNTNISNKSGITQVVDQSDQKDNSLPKSISVKNSDQSNPQVPLITGDGIIRIFFSLINEKKIPEAISMMSDTLVRDDSEKQAWGVQFNAIRSVTVETIEPSNEPEWSPNHQTYMVTLDVVVDPESSNAPIPYYGWGDENPSVRWVSIEKNPQDIWKISSIATGP